MNREVFVDHIGYALGEVTRTVEETGARGDLLSQPDVLREAGFCVHHVSGPRQTAYDFARQAVQTVERELGNVGAIIYSTCIPANANIGRADTYLESRDVKNLMDFPASHLQSDFGLDRAIVIGLSQQACTGLLGSLRLAQALLRSEPETERVLCLTSDRFPEGALYEQSYNLISDGAAACVVSLAPAAFRLLAAHGGCPEPDAPADRFLTLAERLEGAGAFLLTNTIDDVLPMADVVVTATSTSQAVRPGRPCIERRKFVRA